MGKDDYRRRAENATRLAQDAPTDIRRLLLTIAEVWQVLAANARGRDGE